MLTYEFDAFGFTFTGLGTVGNGNGATVPQDPIVGSFTLDGLTLTAIDLAIAGHAYTPAEVGVLDVGGALAVGALVNGVDGILSGTNDFLFYFGADALGLPTGAPFVFTYATDVFDAGCQCTDTFATITGDVAAVPEPSSALLLSTALLSALAVTRLRRKR